MSLIHLARQGFITKSALPNVTRQRGTTTGTANLMIYGAGKDHSIGTNTTFTDSSTNNFTVTRNGDTIQATNNPFTGSVYFDGTDDYLSVANNTALQPGTGTFTIECWIYRGVAGAAHTIYAKGGASTGFVFQVTSSNTLRFTDTTTNIDSTGTIPTLTWTHVAVARSGTGSNQTKLFINGVVDGQGTVATDFNQTEEVRIGTDRSGAADFNGYISCLRFVKGTAVYTANFTVPTSPLTAITNTQLLLLTAQQAPFRDSSSNNFTVTANGNAAGSGLEPFPVNYAGSGYFDGTGDSLQVADNAAFEFGSGDFTLEAWVNLTAYATSNAGAFQASVISKDQSGARQFSFNISGTSTSYTEIIFIGFSSNTVYTIITGSFTFSLNTWYHVAASRSGNNIYIFVNGTQVNTTTAFSQTIQDVSSVVYVGANNFDATYKYALPGYISNVRVIKGTAQYTANFTPPSAPLTAVTNTQLLLLTNNVGPFVDTSANGFPVLRNGDAVQTGFSPFTGQPSAGSAYFDGTGDSLKTATSSSLAMGSGDFTVEAWAYQPTSGSQKTIIAVGASATFGLILYPSTTLQVIGDGGATILSDTAVFPTAEWVHVAFTRSGTTVRLFVNGIQKSSGTNSTNFSGNGIVRIGVWHDDVNFFWTGYISNARVTKGTALYTSNFTPATAPLPAVTNTSLLLNTDNYTIANSTPTYLPVTVNGNTTISTAQYPTGMNRSIYFDGNLDYLSIPANSIFDFGTGDLTVEAWIYIAGNSPLDGSNRRYALIFGVNSTIAASFQFLLRGDSSTTGTGLEIYNGSVGALVSGTISQSTWHHVAVSKSGTSVYFFLNGTQLGTTQTTSGNWGSSTQTATVGKTPDTSAYDFDFNGYISNLRVVKGSALYTANFTPPAAPLPLSVTVPAFVTNNIYGVYQLA